MCRRSTSPKYEKCLSSDPRAVQSSTGPTTSSSSSSSSRSLSPTMNVLVAAIYIAVLPTYCFLNRGFTQWFHHMSIFYLLTQCRFLESFQVLSGTAICLGWYASLIYEYVTYDRFCHPLYRNMPSMLTHFMVVLSEEKAVAGEENLQPALDFDSHTAMIAMVVSHVLDLLAHPLLTYFFWRRHVHHGGTWMDIVTSWPVIISAYLFSRMWSLVHTYHNGGWENMGLFYVGHDVYIMNELDSWYPAYVAEGVVYGSVVLYNLFRGITRTEPPATPSKIDHTDRKPSLLLSESSISMESNGRE